MKQELRDDLMDWKAVPVSQRPRRLSIFPRGLAYFKSWRSLRWFLLLLLPWLPNSIAAYLRGFGPFNSIGLFLVGAVVGGMEATARFEERGKRSRAPGEKGDMKQVALNSKAIRSRSHSEMVN